MSDLDVSIGFELSVNQKTLWCLGGDPGRYYNDLVIAIKGPLEKDKLIRSIRAVIRKHEVLSSRCAGTEDSIYPYQAPGDAALIDLTVSPVREEEDFHRLCGRARKFMDLPYDPSLHEPVRFYLAAGAAGMQYLFIRLYALWGDSYSCYLLYKEVCREYLSVDGDSGPEDEVIPHRNFASWQNELLKEPDADATAFWNKYNYHPGRDILPFGRHHTRSFSPAIKKIGVFSGQGKATIGDAAHHFETDLPCLLLSLFAFCMGKFTDEEITVGYIPFERSYRELNGTLGLLSRPLPIRFSGKEVSTVREAISRIDAAKKAVLEWGDYFDPGSRESVRDRSRIEFPYCFEYIRIEEPGMAHEGKSFELTDLHSVTSPFRLKLLCREQDDQLFVDLYYDEGTLTPAEVSTIGAQLEFLLHRGAADDLPGPSDKEADLIRLSNDTAFSFAVEKTVLDIFSEQAEKTPDHIALVYADQTITYGDLKDRVDKLAFHLADQYQTGPGDLVAISLRRTPLMIIGILGILRSGAAYVPIDPDYPPERMAYILKDCKSPILLCDGPGPERPLNDIAVVDISNENIYKGSPNASSLPVCKPESLAYVIYTSGSTGKPKGCMITHENLSGYIQWANHHYFGQDGSGNWGMITSFSFDLTVTCLYTSLTRGKQLFLGDPDKPIAELLGLCFENPEINTLKLTPSHISLLKEIQIGRTGIRNIICGGEQLTREQVNTIWEIDDSIRIYNEYGPTETTVGAIVKEIKRSDEKIVIGRPVGNMQAFILNADRKMVPVGVSGEIYLGGGGVGAGYFGQPALTAERFIGHPFGGEGKIYKTGDLGRWLPDGDMEYIGRRDEQVKIQGYRIEPGEIENVLLSYPDMEAAAVVVRSGKDGEKELVAFVVGQQDLSASDLRRHMGRFLPAYMIPVQYLQLEKLPLTPNGKIDRVALAGMEMARTAENYIAPRNVVEQKLVSIWNGLLGHERTGITDNFFEVGGHSLKATRLASQIQKVFNVRVPVRDLFVNRTVEEQAVLIEGAKKLQYTHIPVAEARPAYGLSSAQRRLWVVCQDAEASIAYNMPGAYLFEGPLDLAALGNAFNALIQRHEILRTVFREVDGEVRQIILPWQEDDAAIGFRELAVEEVRRLVRDNAVKSFDLEHGPLLRTDIYRIGGDQHVFSFVMHHIVSDGWSMGILIKELLLLYNAYVKGDADPLEKLRVQYKDFSFWEQEQLTGEQLQQHRDFWLGVLGGQLPVLELPSDKIRPAVKTFNAAMVRRDIPAGLVHELQGLCRSEGATVFMGLAAILNTLLYRYTRQTDIIIGSPIAGRAHADLEEQIGFYVNTLALRVRFEPAAGFTTLLQLVKKGALDAYEHQVYPFDELIQGLNLRRDASRSVLFDVMLVLDNMAEPHKGAASELDGIEVRAFSSGEEVKRKFDLTFNFAEMKEEMRMVIDYNTDVFSREWIERMADHLIGLTAAVLSQPGLPLGQLDYLSVAEKNKLLVGFNDTNALYPRDKTIIDLFMQQVALSPRSAALIGGEGTISYQALHERSNRMAAYLREKYAVRPDQLVGIQLERSEWTIITILGILKAGGAYVPIDTDYPKERIRYMVKDSNCTALIDQEALKKFQIEEDRYSSGDPGSGRQPEVGDLAYIIYTSGTTGNPKGVMITHGNLYARICYFKEIYGLGAEDKMLFYRSFSFDGAIEEYLLPVLIGATCVVAPPEFQQDLLGNMEKWVSMHGITKVNMPPALLGEFVQAADETVVKSMSSLRHIVSGGDKLSGRVIREFTARFSADLYNSYGPTENTIDSTNWLVEKGNWAGPVLIGRPVPNSQIYILDDYFQPVPVGIPGELFVSGTGLARGYLNRPELTEEKFLPHPYRTGEKMYSTGDLGRWQADGNIEFIGRSDDQVKIRGYRIELGEIENALQQHALIEAAVMSVWTSADNNKELIAYFVSRQQLHAWELRSYLHKILPAYMLPHQYIRLEALPLTRNGKVDKKALPVPEGSVVGTGMEYIKPRNEREQKLIEVLEDVLKRTPIGIKDDFFILGGDSIKSIQIVSRLKQKGYYLDIRKILKYPVVEEMAACVVAATRLADQGLSSGTISLGPIQASFFRRHPDRLHHYNQSMLLQADGDIREDVLRAALDKIVLHHDALRIVYRPGVGGWIQEYQGAEQSYAFEIAEPADEEEFIAVCDRVQGSMDLAKGPLLQAALFRGPAGDRLLLAVHHLVIDAVSWRILLEDLASLYQQGLSEQRLQLPAKTDSFGYWMDRLSQYALSEDLQKEEAYWSALDALALPSLPVDHADGSNLVRDTAGSSLVLDGDDTKKLLTKCYSAYRTGINDILLTALSLALHREMGVDRVSIGLEGHGREYIGAETDISRTIGWFTSLYPVVFDIRYHGDLIRQLIEVKEVLHRVPAKGIGYGILRYISGKDYRLDPDITFNYLGDLDSAIRTGQGEQIFELSGARRGREIAEQNRRDSVLDVSAMVMNGKLQLYVSYSRGQFEEATISRLLEACRSYLVGLVDLLAGDLTGTLTPADLTYKGLTVGQAAELDRQQHIEDAYPLSPLQEGMYFHWLSAPGSPLYFEQMSYTVKGQLDLAMLEKSYRLLIGRHAITRTIFTSNFGDVSLQVVKRDPGPSFKYHEMVYDPAVVGEADPDLAVDKFREADRATGFELDSRPPIRLTILKLEDSVHELIWSHHHILMDGWCSSILIRDFFHIYYHLIRGEAPALPRVYPYSTFIEWHMRQDKARSMQYWQEYLLGYDTLSTIPRNARAGSGVYESRERKFVIPETLRQSVSRMCSESAVTENTFIQAVWAILLQRYNNTDDVVFGAVVSGRPPELAGVEEMIGLFINTIPVRVRAGDGKTARQLLQDMQGEAIEGGQHHYVQLAEIQSGSKLRGNLFDHILIFENYPVQQLAEQHISENEELSVISYHSFEQANYDLAVMIIPREALTVRIIYNDSVYDESLIARLENQFIYIVRQVIESPDRPIAEIGSLHPAEMEKLIHQFNHTARSFPAGKSLADLFEEQVERTPGHTAVVFGPVALTYRELNEKANEFSDYIDRRWDLRPGDLVGIGLGRNEWAVIAILAVLKSGAAYLPVDPAYPPDRIAFMTTDSGCTALVDEKVLQDFREAMAMDHPFKADNKVRRSTVRDQAYLIYTSGSTGKPKGVMISQAGIVNTILSQMELFEIQEGERGLQFASLSFDASVSEIFIILLSGGALYIIGEEEKKNPALLEAYIRENEIDSATIPPAYLKLLEIEKISTLKKLITAGEAAMPEKAREFSRHGTYFNAYGPTESSICATIYKASRDELMVVDNVPIGVPIANTQIYIVDSRFRLTPIGAAGEICIGGAGLADGYLNRPELTADKFIPNPFRPGEKLYRTGDLGRWLSDGNIEFSGRIDHQVKIRGYRVEPGEIENVLQGHPDVDLAVVLPATDTAGDQELIAYVAGRDLLSGGEIRAYLFQHLPAYMVPARCVILEEIPLTPNGKVDRKQLAKKGAEDRGAGIDLVAPRNEMEKTLVAIWQEVLGKETIGIRDNFFDAGGNSIRIIRLSKLVSAALGREVSVALLFEYSNIADLLHYLGEGGGDAPAAEQAPERNELADMFNKFDI